MKARELKFTIVLICLAVFSCVKKKDPPKPNYGNYTPAINLADYCFFKTGSYWVYQDSVSLKLDSVYVQNAYTQTYEIKESDGKDYIGTFHHYYMKTIDGIGDEREYDIYDEVAAETAKCCEGRYTCEVHWNRPTTATVTGQYFGNYTYMFNVFQNGITGGSGSGEQCWSRGTLTSLNVNSTTFNNIVIFENSTNVSDLNWNVHPYRFKNFISKNTGMVKRIDLDSNRTWKVKRYSIL